MSKQLLQGRVTDQTVEVTMTEETTQASNWFTRSKAFKNLSKWAFSVCDRDNSGEISKSELYTGVILVHLKIAKYAGAAACFPASRKTVDKLFDASDVNKSGTIDEEEFEKIMMVCFGQITTRVAIYFAMVLLIVPCVAHTLYVMFYTALKDRTWAMAVFGLIQAPIAKVPWLDAMFDWDTLLEDLLGMAFFFASFPIIFGTIDNFYQATAEGKMLQSLNESLHPKRKAAKAE